MAKIERPTKVIADNRKARFEYEILYTMDAGIVLTGTEVKSLRAGKCNISDAYAGFTSLSGELYLFNCSINVYEHGHRDNHEPKRVRTLLVRKSELAKLKAASQERGLTIVPLQLYFSGPFVKVLLGVARGKKLHDKRESTKEREIQRTMRREYSTR